MTGGLNNPMNVRATSILWDGETTKAGDAFESFDTLEHGVRAGMKCLLAAIHKHGCTTMGQVVNRYAPASDGNQPARYTAFLEAGLGLKHGACIADKVTDPTFVEKWAALVARFETGRVIAMDVLVAAARDVLGL
jgi:hypothetical protein